MASVADVMPYVKCSLIHYTMRMIQDSLTWSKAHLSKQAFLRAEKFYEHRWALLRRKQKGLSNLNKFHQSISPV